MLGKLLKKKLKPGEFHVTCQVRSKECCLCLKKLTKPIRLVNSTRALYMYHKHWLLLHPKHDKLCQQCHNLTIDKLVIHPKAAEKSQKLKYQDDYKERIISALAILMHSEKMTSMLKNEFGRPKRVFDLENMNENQNSTNITTLSNHSYDQIAEIAEHILDEMYEHGYELSAVLAWIDLTPKNDRKICNIDIRDCHHAETTDKQYSEFDKKRVRKAIFYFFIKCKITCSNEILRVYHQYKNEKQIGRQFHR